MKRRHLLLVALSLIITICMCFGLAACDGCNDTEPTALTTPVVTIETDGTAKWNAVEHASGYAYKISDGEEKTTQDLSVKLTDGQSIVVKAVGDGENFTDSAYSEAKTYTATAPQPTKLSTPVVTINANGLASWEAIPNALSYTTKINGRDSQTNDLAKQLADGDTIQVKANGNGTTYSDSDFSAVKTYNASAPQPAQLDTPVVTIDEDGMARWEAVENAVGYKYVKNTDSEVEISTTSVQLADGDKIKVMAVGDGTNYTDSEYSEEKTYTAGTVTPDPEPELMTHAEFMAAAKDSDVLVKGIVTAFRGTNVFFSDTDGGYYAFKATTVPENLAVGVEIKVTGKKDEYNGLAEIIQSVIEITNATPVTVSPVDATDALANSTSLGDANLIAMQNNLVSLKSATITSVEISEDKNKKPVMNVTLTVGANTVIFYVGGTSQTVDEAQQAEIIELFKANEGKMADVCGIVALYKNAIQIVPANTTPLSNIKNILVKHGTPVVTVDEETGIATWEAVTGATKYMVKIGDTETETTELTKQLADGESIQVKALGDNEVYSDGDYSVAKSFNREPLGTPTIEETTTGAKWTQVTHADGYRYVVTHADGTTDTHETTAYSVQLQNGDKIKVQAMGTGKYKDGEFSTEITYTKPSEPTAIANPTVIVARDGTVTLRHTAAKTFTYKINSGEEQTITNNTETGATLTDKLNPNDEIAVIAVPDPENEMLLPSASDYETAVKVTYKAAVKFDAPSAESFTFEIVAGDTTNVVIKWNAVANATEYIVKYTLNDEPATQTVNKAEITLPLANYGKIEVITAADGDDDVVAGGDYSDKKDASDPVDVTNDYTTYCNETMVATEKKSLEGLFPEEVEENKDFELRLTGKTYSAVSISWTIEGEPVEYAKIENDKLIIDISKLTSNEVIISLKAVIKLDNIEDSTVPPFSIKLLKVDAVKFDFSTATGSSSTATPYTYAELKIDSNNNSDFTNAKIEKVYPYTKNGTGTLRIGQKSAGGTLTLTFSKNISHIKIEYSQYADGEKNKITINDTESQPTDDRQSATINFTSPANTITISTTSRCCVYSLAVYFKEMTDSDRLDIVENSIVIPDPTIADGVYTYSLPLTGDYASTITWNVTGLTADDSYNSDTGVLTVKQRAEDVIITATPTVTVGSETSSNPTANAKTLTIPSTSSKSWTLVTDMSQISDGSQIIIASASTGSGVALSTTQNTNNRGETDFNVTNPSSDVQIITVESGTTNGTFVLKATNGYLYAAGGTSKNYLRTNETKNATCDWNITINTNSSAKIVAADSTITKNTMRYNSSASCFSCYASGQADIYMYVLV